MMNAMGFRALKDSKMNHARIGAQILTLTYSYMYVCSYILDTWWTTPSRQSDLQMQGLLFL